MTVEQAFISELDEISVTESTIEKTLIDRGLDGTAKYIGSDEQKRGIDMCVIDSLYKLFTRPDIKEGDFAKSHPDFLRKVEARLLYLAKKHNVTEVLNVLEEQGPQISDASNLW